MLLLHPSSLGQRVVTEVCADSETETNGHPWGIKRKGLFFQAQYTLTHSYSHSSVQLPPFSLYLSFKQRCKNFRVGHKKMKCLPAINRRRDRRLASGRRENNDAAVLTAPGANPLVINPTVLMLRGDDLLRRQKKKKSDVPT